MEWFDNQIFISMVKNNLPRLFKKAEIESMRGGKIGMEVGVLRERILIALLLKSFGEENVKFDFSSTDNSKDTQVFDDILSIKTFMNNGYGGVKVFWASDNKTVKNAVDNYIPQNHILISNINWGTKNGGLYLISLNTQLKIFNTIGVENYLKINNGNNRGISIQTEVLKTLLSHQETKHITVDWVEPNLNYNIYERWINEMN
jgi:hypothetical protein